MQSILTYNGQEITQRTEDGYVNATEMSKANNYVLAELIRSDRFKNYLKVLENSDSGLSPESVVIVTAEGFPAIKTTWVHPLVALMIAQDISPEFHVWCNIHIKTLIETGSTAIAPEKPMSQDDQMLLLAESVQRLIGEKRKLQSQLADQEPKVEFFDAIHHSPELNTLGNVITALGIGRNTGFRMLREMGIIQKTCSLPYQRYCDSGYFKIELKTSETIKGVRQDSYAKVTGKGEIWVAKKLAEYVRRESVTVAVESEVELIG
jgi:phage antirepressor YoqD-like protein